MNRRLNEAVAACSFKTVVKQLWNYFRFSFVSLCLTVLTCRPPTEHFAVLSKLRDDVQHVFRLHHLQPTFSSLTPPRSEQNRTDRLHSGHLNECGPVLVEDPKILKRGGGRRPFIANSHYDYIRFIREKSELLKMFWSQYGEGDVFSLHITISSAWSLCTC